MVKEFELISLDGLSSFFKSNRHAFVLDEGQTCLNCETVLEGRYCHVCGQDASKHHRHILHIIFSGIEGLFHLDTRLWRTFPPLFFAPGRLAKDYIDGRLNRHVPPFRTFLVALLAFIFVSEQVVHHYNKEAEAAIEVAKHDLKDPAKIRLRADQMVLEAKSDFQKGSIEAKNDYAAELKAAKNNEDRQEAKAEYDKAIKALNDEYTEAQRDPLTAAKTQMEREARGLFNVVENKDSNVKIHVANENTKEGAKLKSQVIRALNNPEATLLSMFGWGHRLTVLLLPILTLLLGILYFYKKRFFLYDHFLVSCNLLSFAFFTNAIVLALPESWRIYGFGLLAFWTPINMFMTLRGAYGSSLVGGVLKTLFLWFSSTISFLFLLWLVFFVAVITA